MKNSKEMADAVFRIRDEYLLKKRRQNETVKRAAVIGVPAFAVFALMIGVGAALDRREIGTDSIARAETAPATNGATIPETIEVTSKETNTLRDTAMTSKVTKKQTKSVTTLAVEGASPVTIIPGEQSGTAETTAEETAHQTAAAVISPAAEETVSETMIPEGRSETAADPDGEAPARQITTTSVLADNHSENAPVFQPDEETDAVPESMETVNEAAIDRLGDVYIGGAYYLQTFTATEPLTPDRYLGSGGDFEGYYSGDTSVSFYTAKERSDVVIVVFYDSSRVILKRTD